MTHISTSAPNAMTGVSPGILQGSPAEGPFALDFLFFQAVIAVGKYYCLTISGSSVFNQARSRRAEQKKKKRALVSH